MFDSVASKFQEIFKNIRGWGTLSEENIARGLREVRVALLSADVHYQVVKDILRETEAEVVGEKVGRSITPGQQFIKIFHQRMVKFMSDPSPGIRLAGTPAVIMLVGLQGSGKTTTAAKLARRYREQGQVPLLAAADVRRPAAAEQLFTLGERIGVESWRGPGNSALTIARDALKYARSRGHSPLILDTAGRLHVDPELMAELVELKSELRPSAVLLVLDAMTGQDAVNVAREFERAVGIDGAVLTKLDGDARGGAAISLRAVTGRPVKLVGVGEKLEDLVDFDPARLVSRILGMGDILSLVEKAEAIIRRGEQTRREKKARRGDFTLEDFHRQLKQMRGLGTVDSLLQMLPGALPRPADGEARLKRVDAILNSMTRKERERPEIIDGGRRKRIAGGSGTSVPEVNQVLKQFFAIKKLMGGAKTRRGGGWNFLPFR